MENESIFISNHQPTMNGWTDQSNRRLSRRHNETSLRLSTSYEYEFDGYDRRINQLLEQNDITFLSDNTITVVVTNSSQVKLFDPDWWECILEFG